MTPAIVKVTTQGGFPLFYSGKAGHGWLCEAEAEALVYDCFESAQRMADRIAKQYAGTGLRAYAIHRPHTYRLCLVRGSGNWDLFLMPSGEIRAVPTEAARLRGSRESYYGDRDHLRTLIQAGEFSDLEGFTEAGLEFMTGLTSGLRAGVLSFRAA